MANKVFVGELPATVTEDMVRNHFGQFGAVSGVSLKYVECTGGFRGVVAWIGKMRAFYVCVSSLKNKNIKSKQ
jgi:hypothetical protein